MPVSFEAIYYDGVSSTPHDAVFSVDDNVNLICDQYAVSVPLAEITLRPAIGQTARKILLPSGASLEVADHRAIETLIDQYQLDAKETRAHFLENNLRFVYLSFALLIAIGFLGFKYGLPAASKLVAHSLPVSVDEMLGKGVLAQLDDYIFSPSELDEATQIKIQTIFDDVLIETGHNYRLEFRSSDQIGPNAFALPDGTIVMTDQMVNIVDDHEHLSAILLHEIGHVKHRHALQGVIRKAGISTMILLLTGDVSVASSLVVLMPTVLIETSYSRQFETESDDYALEKMLAMDIPPEYFALVMEKIVGLEASSAEHGADDQAVAVELLDYFSTHPPTDKRMARFRNATKQ